MSKFDEILNSSDASDALLGEQIDALDEQIDALEQKKADALTACECVRVLRGATTVNSATLTNLENGMYIYMGYGSASANSRYSPVAYLLYIIGDASGNAMLKYTPLTAVDDDNSAVSNIAITGRVNENTVTITYKQNKYHIANLIKFNNS